MYVCGSDPWFRKIPWRRAWHSTPVFLPGESHGLRNLAGYSSQGHSQTQLKWLSAHTRTLCEHSSESYSSVEVCGADLQLYIVKKIEKKKNSKLSSPWNGKEDHIIAPQLVRVQDGPSKKQFAVCLKSFSPLTIIKWVLWFYFSSVLFCFLIFLKWQFQHLIPF